MTSEKLAELKKELLEIKSTLTARVEKIEHNKTRPDGPLASDWEEQAVELENYDVVDALEESELKELAQIDSALERMEKGTYGTCVSCRKPIGEARIMAIPFATKCIDCAE
jgi:DnaK suppressor protein